MVFMAPLLERLRSLSLNDKQTAFVWLGQAGFALFGRGKLLLVDPFLSEIEGRAVPQAFDPEQAAGVDAILCTHEHIDHFDANAVHKIMKASRQTKLVVPSPIVAMVAEAIGVEETLDRIVGLQPGEAWRIGNVGVSAVPACHGVGMKDAYNFGEALSEGKIRYLGYVVDAGVRTYHAGDTIVYEGMVEAVKEQDVEVAFLPINGRSAEREAMDIVGNMNEREAVELAAAIGAEMIVPMHYDMFAVNPGRPDLVVEIVRTGFPELNVMVPPHFKTVVLTSVR